MSCEDPLITAKSQSRQEKKAGIEILNLSVGNRLSCKELDVQFLYSVSRHSAVSDRYL